MIDPRTVAHAHDAMAAEYDTIEDLWYAHLFNEIHRFVLDALPAAAELRALDVGCGTGFQSYLLARAGAIVRGFDIASALVDRARGKREAFMLDPQDAWPFHRTSLAFFDAEHRRIVARADRARGDRPACAPDFVVADATDPAAYGKGGFGMVVCCGSVLSFIDDHGSALDLMAGALSPGGVLVLEVEQRFNLDLLWPALDRVLGTPFEYGQSWREIRHNLLAAPSENVRVDYPFELASGEEVELPIWLFSPRWLDAAFTRRGLSVVARRGVHVATNLIPSTVLHRARPSRFLQAVARPLCAADRAIAGLWPFWGLGCSVMYAVRRSADR